MPEQTRGLETAKSNGRLPHDRAFCTGDAGEHGGPSGPRYAGLRNLHAEAPSSVVRFAPFMMNGILTRACVAALLMAAACGARTELDTNVVEEMPALKPEAGPVDASTEPR